MRNLQLCIFYDGNGNRACVLDFGRDPAFGPFGNQEAMMQALAAKNRSEDCSVTALIDWSDKGDLDDADIADAANQVILDDEALDTLEIVRVEPR